MTNILLNFSQQNNVFVPKSKVASLNTVAASTFSGPLRITSDPKRVFHSRISRAWSFLSFGIFIVICLSFVPKTVHAQTSLSVAVTYQIIDTDIKDGDLICAKPTGYGLCDSIYDPSMYGIVSLNPALKLENSGLKDTKPLVTTGKAYIRVNSSNGAIKKGDYITASKSKGVGMKADKSGFVLGTAIDDYDNQDKEAVGNIVVSLGIRPVVLSPGAATNLIQLLKQGIDAAFYSPISALRYFLAAFIVAASFILAFIYFGRIAKSGIEALGRNPLASRTIQFGIFTNVFFMIVIVGAGLGISYLILIL